MNIDRKNQNCMILLPDVCQENFRWCFLNSCYFLVCDQQNEPPEEVPICYSEDPVSSIQNQILTISKLRKDEIESPQRETMKDKLKKIMSTLKEIRSLLELAEDEIEGGG
jgi:hypothetical protein